MGSWALTLTGRESSAFAKPAADKMADEPEDKTEGGGNPFPVPPLSDATVAFPVLTMQILACKGSLSTEKRGWLQGSKH